MQIAKWYLKHLGKIRKLDLQKEAPWAKNVYWMFCVLVDINKTKYTVDILMQELRARGVDTRPFFIPIHKQPIYSEYAQTKLPETERLSSVGLNLPSSINLNENDVIIICNVFKEILI